MKIQKNLGTVDRTVRIIAGVFLLFIVALAFVGPESVWAFWGLLGLFPLINTYKGGALMNALPAASIKGIPWSFKVFAISGLT